MKMNKEEFLKQLENLLSDISAEERADAMAYYHSYFEDAGEGNEASIIEELESPEKVAELIKRDLGIEMQTTGADQSQQSDGQNHASGQQTYDYYNPNANRDAEYYQNVNATINNLQQEKKKSDNTVWWVLLVVLLVFTSPVWLGLLAGVAGTLFGIAVAIVAVTGALLVTGVVLIGVGIGCIVSTSAIAGIALIGAGLLVLALGMLALIATVWIFGGFIPWVCKGIYRLCKKPFEKRKEQAAV